MLPSLFSISNLLTLFPVEERGIFYALHGSIQGTHHVYVSRLLQNCYPQCSYYFYPMKQMSELDIYPDFKPNATTIAAMAETDEMIRTGSGQHFEGSTEELFSQILEE